MTTVQELPYPLRLCVELLHHAALAGHKTQNMTSSQIKEAAGLFFDDETVTKATDILCGRFLSPPVEVAWDIRDSLGSSRGEEMAKSPEEAIAKAAIRMGTTSDRIRHYVAVPKVQPAKPQTEAPVDFGKKLLDIAQRLYAHYAAALGPEVVSVGIGTEAVYIYKHRKIEDPQLPEWAKATGLVFKFEHVGEVQALPHLWEADL